MPFVELHQFRINRNLNTSSKGTKKVALKAVMSAKNDNLIFQLCIDPDYEINKDGTIKTLIQQNGKRGTTWREIGNSDTPDRYKCMRYKSVTLRVHRIIWAKFMGFLRADLVINHIDGNKSNNNLANLEHVTESDNLIHAYRRLGRPVNRGNAKLSWSTVSEIRNDWNNGQYTLRKLQEKYKVPKTTVHMIVNFKTYKTEQQNGEN